ncbi:hypothetical protein MMC21_006121 [Puttea exsequens]|nr:hypothetical protein [Puttea exsequens]
MSTLAVYIDSLTDPECYKLSHWYYKKAPFRRIKNFADFLNIAIDRDCNGGSFRQLSDSSQQRFEETYKHLVCKAQGTQKAVSRNGIQALSQDEPEPPARLRGGAEDQRHKHVDGPEEVDERNDSRRRRRRGTNRRSVRFENIESDEEGRHNAGTAPDTASEEKISVHDPRTQLEEQPSQPDEPIMTEQPAVEEPLQAEHTAGEPPTEAVAQVDPGNLAPDEPAPEANVTEAEEPAPVEPALENPPPAEPQAPREPSRPVAQPQQESEEEEEEKPMAFPIVPEDRYGDSLLGKWVINAPERKWRSKKTGKLCNHGPGWVRPHMEPIHWGEVSVEVYFVIEGLTLTVALDGQVFGFKKKREAGK